MLHVVVFRRPCSLNTRRNILGLLLRIFERVVTSVEESPLSRGPLGKVACSGNILHSLAHSLQMTFSTRWKSLCPGGRALRRLGDRRSSGHSKIRTHWMSLRLESLGWSSIRLQSGGRLCISCSSFLIMRSVLARLLGYGLATDAQARSN